MKIITILALLLLGLAGAGNLIKAKLPETKKWLTQLTPYQGWIGIGCIAIGFYWIVDTLLHLPPQVFIFVADVALLIMLGFLLGVGILKSFVQTPGAIKKFDRMEKKLAPYQGMLGIIAMIAAIITLVVLLNPKEGNWNSGSNAQQIQNNR